MLLNCGVKTLESPLDYKKIQPVHPNGNQSWIFIGRTDVKAETPILWPPDAKNWLICKNPWCWERLKAGGEGDNRRWDGWMASPTRWTWISVSSRSWWWTGKPGMLPSMGPKELDTTECLNRTEQGKMKMINEKILTKINGEIMFWVVSFAKYIHCSSF